MKEYYIRPIAATKGRRDMPQFTYGMNYGQTLSTCHYVWYIEGSEQKTLVDAGCTADMFHVRGHPSEEQVQPLEMGLGKLGLVPEDIRVVIFTHFHWDHVELAYKFRRAKFIVQKTEMDFALKPHPYVARLYDRNMFQDLDLDIVEGDNEIFEGVKVLFTPGHSAGGQSVAVQTPKGVAIIPGFCSISENFDPPPAAKARGLSVVPPGLHINVLQAYDSALRVKEAADIILPLHDARFMNIDRIP
jgi:N-acyl homoserine lactone hydrolase